MQQVRCTTENPYVLPACHSVIVAEGTEQLLDEIVFASLAPDSVPIDLLHADPMVCLLATACAQSLLVCSMCSV